MERFACPTPDVQGRYRCIDDHVLCDGFIDCPEGEDEDRRSCMFYKTVNKIINCLVTIKTDLNNYFLSNSLIDVVNCLKTNLFLLIDKSAFGCVGRCSVEVGQRPLGVNSASSKSEMFKLCRMMHCAPSKPTIIISSFCSVAAGRGFA